MRIRTRRRRPGAINAIELMLLMPIIMAILLGIVEVSLLIAAQTRVSAACWLGARSAAHGDSLADVQRNVVQSFPPQAQNSFVVNVIVPETDSNGQPVMFPTTSKPISSSGSLPGDGDWRDQAAAQASTTVSVRVQVPANALVPDLLGFIGLSLRNQTLGCETIMRRE